jgi:hypothetical protein
LFKSARCAAVNFLQHVLPTGFMKIRCHGLMNPNCAVLLERIRGLIELGYGFTLDLPVSELEPRRQSTCQAAPVCSSCARSATSHNSAVVG